MSKNRLEFNVKYLLKNMGVKFSLADLYCTAKNIIMLEEEIIKQPSMNDINLLDFANEQEDNIDIEKLILRIIKNQKDVIEKLKSDVSKSTYNFAKYNLLQRNIDYLQEAIKDSKAEIPIFISKDDDIDIDYFYSVDNVFGRKNEKNEKIKKQNSEILKSIKDSNDLYNVFSLVTDDEMRDFIYYNPSNNSAIEYYIYKNYMNEVFELDSIHDKDELKKEVFIRRNKYYSKIIEKFPEKFDINKLLLLAAYNAKYEYEQNNTISSEDVARIMLLAKNCIADERVRLSGKKKIANSNEYIHVDYSYKKLLNDIERIYKGHYFSLNDISNTKKYLIESDTKNKIEIDFFYFLKFNSKEMSDLIKSYRKNLEVFAYNNIIGKDEIKEQLDNLGDYVLSEEFLEYLYEHQIIGKDELVKLFIKGNAYISKVLELKDKYDIKDLVNSEELIKKFRNMKENPETELEFNKYALLFIELNVKGKSKEDLDNISEQIMEELYKTDSDYDEDLKILYKKNILPIGTLLDYSGKEIIYDLLKNKSLHFNDAKNLFLQEKLDLNRVYNIISKYYELDEEKINFIYGTFNGFGNTKEEAKKLTEAGDYLIQAINVSEEFHGFNGGIKTKKSSTGNELNTKSHKTTKISNPLYRWGLLNVIDDNVQSTAYADGTVIFELPNLNNGTVIIEQLFKKNSMGKTEPKINAATYIMSKETFLENKSELVLPIEKINRHKLVEMKKKDGNSSSINHSLGWGKNLKEKLGIKVNSRYDEEKIAEIDRLISEIEKSRENC